MQKHGNAEYTIEVKQNGENKKLKTPTKKELEELEKNMQKIYKDISTGKIKWFIPSRRIYQLAIKIKENEKQLSIEFQGRPLNAIGYNLAFLKLNFPINNSNDLINKIEELLNSLNSWKKVQEFFKQFNNKKPRYKDNYFY